MHAKAQLAKILAALPHTCLSGYFYRSVDNFSLYSFNPPNPLYSLSPGKTGQRFTPKDGPPALYVADQANTAFAEGTHSITSSLAGTITPPAPVVVFAINVNLKHILDLTNADVLNALATTIAELQGSWQVDTGIKPPTHLLAEVAYKTPHLQGMLFNSKESPGGKNLIIWTNKVRTPSYVEVYDPTGKLATRIPKKRR